MKLRQVISEHSYISVSLLISIIGAVVWATTLFAETKNNSQAINRIELSQEKYTDHLNQINTRLSRIEGKLDKK
jgi:hypothetical protein